MTHNTPQPNEPKPDTTANVAPVKQPWEAPAIVWHAPITEHTQGISFHIGDGINNLS